MTGPVFDFHARLVRRPDALHTQLATMDAVGIARAAVSAGGLVDLDRISAQILDGGRSDARADNDWVRRCCSDSGGRLVPFFFADPYADVETYRAHAKHFRGLEISPAVHGFGIDAPEVAALVGVAASARHPVYVVCLGRHGARAGDLVELARAFPDVTFVLGHCGWTAIDTAGLGEIAPYENIAAETSGCFTAVAEVALRRLGPDRVLFGTEYPLQHPSVELAKLTALRLAPPVWQKVAWRNAHLLLGEEIPCTQR